MTAPEQGSDDASSQERDVRESEVKAKSHRISWGFGICIVVGGLLCSIVWAFWPHFFASKNNENVLDPLGVTDPSKVSESRQPSVARAQEIVKRVRNHIRITEDFDPTVAEIIDASALRSKNDFYAEAVNGDFLIVTPTFAVLYRPSTDMILSVVPITLEQQ